MREETVYTFVDEIFVTATGSFYIILRNRRHPDEQRGYTRKYANQPRVPAGEHEGGQFASGRMTEATAKKPDVRALYADLGSNPKLTYHERSVASDALAEGTPVKEPHKGKHQTPVAAKPHPAAPAPYVAQPAGGTTFDREKLKVAMRQITATKTQHACGAKVAGFLYAAGFHIKPGTSFPRDAKDMEPSLANYGYQVVERGTGDYSSYVPQIGDAVVIQGTSGSYSGHVAMWNGKQWVSDYRQSGGLRIYPGGRTYEHDQPKWVIMHRPD